MNFSIFKHPFFETVLIIEQHFRNFNFEMRNNKHIAGKKLTFMLAIFFLTAAATRAQRMYVYIALSETCPICKSITAELRSLSQQYNNADIAITGIFPNAANSTAESRAAFGSKYKINFPLIADSAYRFAHTYNIQTLPEVIVLDSTQSTIIYRGLIDDSFVTVGKRRGSISKRYLRDALEAYLKDNSYIAPYTKPVGCILTYPK